ncbi:MAG: virulence factor TspB C-terminal domain-related protein [Carnobacterium sp.]|uniref:virulence factor TspB C-terminal domain-related protein n=1 Tax=Carnobacterium sp. TaxID=48221 RepID=UPI002FC85D77
MYIRFNSSCCKTFLVYLICLSVLFRPTFAHASNLGGWTLSNPVAKAASTLYQGAKDVMINGKNVAKTSTALITPRAIDVSKVLARGVAGYALSVAVEQLLGAVDWVLDPVNHEIRYKEIVCPDGSKDCASDLLYQAKWESNQVDWHYSRDAACTATAARMASVTGNPWKFSGKYSVNNECIMENKKDPKNIVIVHLSVITKPNDKPAEAEEKKLPLDTVSSKVISNAQSGDASAQSATSAAAADIVADAEKDAVKARPIVDQLEANAKTQTDETATGDATKPNTADPTAPPEVTKISLEFPIFCDWAPTVCEAAQAAISFPTLVTEWWNTANTKAEEWVNSISTAWTTFKDWMKEEEKPIEQEKPQIQEPDLSLSVTNYIQFGSQCPQDRQIPLSMGGQTLNLVISYQPLCIVAQQFRPAVILMAFLAGAFIITNTGRRAETGD